MPIGIIAGDPGTTWTNDTTKIKWQLVCNLGHTCGQCLQYHLQVGNFWPIPFHRSCRCRQHQVYPGQTAQPFADFREVIDSLSVEQRNRVIGASNLKLVESGTVKWGDVVTAGRVRTLAEVVGREKLSVKDLTKAGLSPSRARRAYGSAHGDETEAARRSARSIAEVLKGQGLSAAEIHKATGQIIAERVGIKAGPSGESGPGVTARLRRLPILPGLAAEAIRIPPPANTPISTQEARRLIVAAVGEEAAALLEEMPATMGELDRLITRLNGAVDQEAFARMRAYLGVK